MTKRYTDGQTFRLFRKFTHTHTMKMTADPNYQEGRRALIECHGSLHRSACVQKIELVFYMDTKQTYGKATGRQQEIRLESASGGQEGGGGKVAKKKKKRIVGERVKTIQRWERRPFTLISQTCRAALPLCLLLLRRHHVCHLALTLIKNNALPISGSRTSAGTGLVFAGCRLNSKRQCVHQPCKAGRKNEREAAGGSGDGGGALRSLSLPLTWDQLSVFTLVLPWEYCHD